MKLYWKIVIGLAGVIVVLNALGFFTPFCDFYTAHIYGALTLPLSKLTAGTSVAIGEILMYAAAAMLVLALVLTVLRIFLRHLPFFACVVRIYLKTCLIVLLCGLLLFTLNWSIPFRATPLSSTFSTGEHTLSELQTLRNYIISGMNEAAADAPRDESGNLVYSDDVSEKVASAMAALGSEFPQLGGYYPPMKDALCSDVLEWMGIGGYTYPYTMELTYNHHVTQLYFPSLYAHESVHHKGCYLESEANFFAYLGCSRSEDAIVRYSAYESVYYYVENAYVNALMDAYDSSSATQCFNAQPQLSEQVSTDLNYVAEQREQAYEENVDKQAEEEFSGLAQSLSEVGWSTQDQVLQENNYSGVVGLLLDYYQGKL